MYFIVPFSKTMCQVLSYRRLKTIENSKTVPRKSGRGCLWKVVVYERFQYKALTENIFSILDRWLIIGGGHLPEMVTHGGLTVCERGHLSIEVI